MPCRPKGGRTGEPDKARKTGLVGTHLLRLPRYTPERKTRFWNKNDTSFARHIDDEERLLLALVVSKIKLVAGSVLDLEVEDGGGGRSAFGTGREPANNGVKMSEQRLL